MKSEYNSKQELNVVLQVAVRRFPIYKERDLLYYNYIEFAEIQGEYICLHLIGLERARL